MGVCGPLYGWGGGGDSAVIWSLAAWKVCDHWTKALIWRLTVSKPAWGGGGGRLSTYFWMGVYGSAHLSTLALGKKKITTAYIPWSNQILLRVDASMWNLPSYAINGSFKIPTLGRKYWNFKKKRTPWKNPVPGPLLPTSHHVGIYRIPESLQVLSCVLILYADCRDTSFTEHIGYGRACQ